MREYSNPQILHFNPTIFTAREESSNHVAAEDITTVMKALQHKRFGSSFIFVFLKPNLFDSSLNKTLVDTITADHRRPKFPVLLSWYLGDLFWCLSLSESRLQLKSTPCSVVLLFSCLFASKMVVSNLCSLKYDRNFLFELRFSWWSFCCDMANFAGKFIQVAHAE